MNILDLSITLFLILLLSNVSNKQIKADPFCKIFELNYDLNKITIINLRLMCKKSYITYIMDKAKNYVS